MSQLDTSHKNTSQRLTVALVALGILVVFPERDVSAAEQQVANPGAGVLAMSESEEPRQGLFKRLRARRDARKYKQLQHSLDKYEEPKADADGKKSQDTKNKANPTSVKKTTQATSPTKAERVESDD